VQVDRRADDPLRALKRFVTGTRERVLIVAESLGRRETMQQYFAEYGLKPAVVPDWAGFIGSDASPALAVAPLHTGFVWAAANFAVITEAELYATAARRLGKREARRSNVDAMLRDLSEMRIGDPVVHEQHGIGRYLGLTTLNLGDGANEFLHLLYANDAKLYVPVSSLHLVSRYSGASPEAAPLHELGSGQWEKAKKKAAQQAHDTAAELLNLYAQRAARQGHAFKFDVHQYEAFADPFSDLPVKLAELSRFRSSAETKTAIEGIGNGKVDLVIGTHKLIQSDVKFDRLGLVIIDEEHRFGVRQKEQLKRLRAEVDVLTLTATPIPRTLAMSLEGIRDFSVIATAPEKRLAIKTFVAPYSVGIVREAALRELKRGGQIYFLHNDIDTIRTTAERLGQLLPEARIAVAHGQMGERELEHVMRDFYAQRINLLVCSTIIETGIDVPTANTMIIDRADRFGLAQLHQL